MRIDVFSGGRRPLPAKLMLKLAHKVVGVDLGPPTLMTFRPDIFPSAFMQYLVSSVNGAGGWSKGQGEMFSAFVSQRNSCTF